MINKIKELIRNAKKMDIETIGTIKYTLFLLLVVDLVGVYWYFNMTRIGMALLIVLMVAISIILILEKGKLKGGNKMKDKKGKVKEEPSDEDDDEESDEEDAVKEEEPKELGNFELGNFDLGLPSAEEFNKRLEKAIGI